MRIYHFQAAPLLPHKRSFAVSRAFKSNGSPSVLQHFAPLAQLQPKTVINWSRTFSLKGFRFEDYQMEDARDDRLYRFTRSNNADPALPVELRFQHDYFAAGPLKGEVLTQTREELMLGVEEVGFFEGYIAGSETHEIFSRIFQGDAWGLDFSQVQEIHEHLVEGLRPNYLNWFMKRWNPGKSLLHFELH